jgi:hypothetical protein
LVFCSSAAMVARLDDEADEEGLSVRPSSVDLGSPLVVGSAVGKLGLE